MGSAFFLTGQTRVNSSRCFKRSSPTHVACHYCGESILATARKCMHCGERLDSALRTADENKRAEPVEEKPRKGKGLNRVIMSDRTVIFVCLAFLIVVAIFLA